MPRTLALSLALTLGAFLPSGWSQVLASPEAVKFGAARSFQQAAALPAGPAALASPSAEEVPAPAKEKKDNYETAVDVLVGRLIELDSDAYGLYLDFRATFEKEIAAEIRSHLERVEKERTAYSKIFTQLADEALKAERSDPSIAATLGALQKYVPTFTRPMNLLQASKTQVTGWLTEIKTNIDYFKRIIDNEEAWNILVKTVEDTRPFSDAKKELEDRKLYSGDVFSFGEGAYLALKNGYMLQKKLDSYAEQTPKLSAERQVYSDLLVRLVNRMLSSDPAQAK